MWRVIFHVGYRTASILPTVALIHCTILPTQAITHQPHRHLHHYRRSAISHRTTSRSSSTVMHIQWDLIGMKVKYLTSQYIKITGPHAPQQLTSSRDTHLQSGRDTARSSLVVFLLLGCLFHGCSRVRVLGAGTGGCCCLLWRAESQEARRHLCVLSIGWSCSKF